MKTRTILMTALFTLASLTVYAQENVVEQINEVKVNPDLCYGEGADEDVQKATDIAIDDLCARLSKKTSTDVDKKDVAKKIKKLERKRGSQTRMLVYVALSDFKASSSSSSSPSSSLISSSTTTTTTSTPKSQNQQTLVSTAQTMQTVVPSQPVGQTTSVSKEYAKATDVVAALKMVKHFGALRNLLSVEKDDGRVKDYGTAAHVADSDKVYWCIYRKIDDYRLEYVAVLSPLKANGKRDNLDTGAEETPTDYTGNTYDWVWFILP